MASFTLACGPYFDEGGMLGSWILFLVVKPLAYFAFIQAFRYRVSRTIPMRFSQAAWLAAARAGLGLVLIGGFALIFLHGAREGQQQIIMVSWVYLYAERLFSWWLIGWKGAGIRGRRLVGWIISGTLINVAFDIAMVWGLISGMLPQAAIVAGIAVFILALHLIGRRTSLRLRFSSNARCVSCQYDLTGNLSGRCPECGQTVMTPKMASAVIA